MSYQVIARKWRPQAFEEVTGQEPITRTLRGAIEHDRLHHAYLFSGARGVGKTTTARLLAKALNCHKSDRPTPTPCKVTDADACASCREIAEGRSIDVLEIDAASNTGVDNVRDTIINTVGVRPARDRYKVFIIDEVHMLSGAAFNALLKTLEEPPPRVVFIMATTESHKIPDTILSRSQQFEFRIIPTQKIAERLRLIADAEKIKIKDEALREVARAGEGSMRDAQSAFDQVISFSEGEITPGDVETALGIAGAELRARVMRAVAKAEAREALAVVDDLVMRGHDLRNFCRDIMTHVRDLLVTKVAGENEELTNAGEAERRELVRAAGEFSESDLVRFFHSLTETEQRLREGAHPRYQLEIGLVKLIEMRRLAPLGQILERLSALEEALRNGQSHAPAAGSSSPTGSAGGAAPVRGRGGSTPPAPSSRFSDARAGSSEPQSIAPPNGDGSADSAARSGTPSVSGKPSGSRGVASEAEGTTVSDDAPPWEPRSISPPLKLVEPPRPTNSGGLRPVPAPAVMRAGQEDLHAPPHQGQASTLLERLKGGLEDRNKPFLAVALDGAHRVELVGDELCIYFAPDKKFLRDSLSKPENARLLREVCAGLLGREVGVRFGTGQENAVASAGVSSSGEEEERRERQRLREVAESHPAVQELLRTFRGEIVNVRRVEEKGGLES